MKYSKEQLAESKRELSFPQSTKFYTYVVKRSASSLTTKIRVLVIDSGRIRDVTHLAACACGYRWDEKNAALVMGGLGLDIGYELVYHLGLVTHGTGAAFTHSWI